MMDEFDLHTTDVPVSFERAGLLQVVVTGEQNDSVRSCCFQGDQFLLLAFLSGHVDTGVGMTEDQLSRLFQRGVQFNANELQAGKGSGLGLYIAKGICERHGGSLVPASEGLGKGTTFTLTIPLHHIPDAALPKLCRRMSCSRSKAPPERQNSTPRSTSFSPGKDDQLKILVVDDSGLNRKLLVRLVWHCFAPSKIFACLPSTSNCISGKVAYQVWPQLR